MKKLIIFFLLFAGVLEAQQPLRTRRVDTDTLRGYTRANAKVLVPSGDTLSVATMRMTPGTLTDGGTALKLTAVMPTTITGTTKAIDFNLTSAGASQFFNIGYNIDYLQGYNGSGYPVGLRVSNMARTSANEPFGALAAIGIYGQAADTSSGSNVGVMGVAEAAKRTIGLYGWACAYVDSSTNIGIQAFGRNPNTGSKMVGGYFGLNNSDPTITTSCALVADNADIAANIFSAKDNSVDVFTIADGGNINATGWANFSGGIRSQTKRAQFSGNTAPADSAGVEIGYSSALGVGVIQCRDRTAGLTQNKPLYWYSGKLDYYMGVQQNLVFSVDTNAIAGSAFVRGSNAFTGTATGDTVAVTGATVNDYYWIQLTGAAAPAGADACTVTATATGFILTRSGSGTSGLTYNWLRMK